MEPIDHGHDQGLVQAVLASRPELLPWMPWAVAPSIDKQFGMVAAALRDWAAGRAFHFAVVESGKPLAVVGVNRIGPDEGEIHYWMRTDRTGQGLATEAAAAMVSFAFEELGLASVVLHIGEANLASRRIAENLGARLVGPLAEGMEGGLGRFPAVVYRLDRSP